MNENRKLIHSFNPDSYENPYRRGQSMVPMTALPDQVAELPTSLSYYRSPDDLIEPAFQFEAGTRVVLYSDDIPMRGYGIQSWPTYQREWRHAAPFYLEGDKSREDSAERSMYYIRYSDVLKLAEALDRDGELRWAFETADGVTPEIE